MGLPTVDMDDCCKKQRCLSGPNVGQAYSICDPCQGIGEFNEDLCDCELQVCNRWLIDYEHENGGYFGCGESCGTGFTPALPYQLTLDFNNLQVTYTGFVNFGSISGSCDTGPLNCFETVGSWTGADYYMPPGSQSLATADNVGLPCGNSDRLFALFTVLDIPSNGIYAGSVIARFITSRWGGAVGCILVQSWITGVTPLGCDGEPEE